MAGSKIRFYNKDEIVIRNGESVNEILIVVSGALVVQKEIDIEKNRSWPTKINRNAPNPDRKF